MGLFNREPVEPSQSTKILLVVVSVLAAFFTSGVIYGYSGLYKVLAVDEHVFQSSCGPSEMLPCEGQSRSLTAAYTLGAATVSGAAIFIGVFLDKVGPRWTVVSGSVVFATGLLAMAFVEKVSDTFIFVGFFLLSLGGPAIFNAMLNFAELFPVYSAAIIAAQNGMFDASSVVLFLMGKIVELFKVPLSAVMLAYLVVPLALFVVGLTLVADRPYGTIGEGEEDVRNGELWRVYNIRVSSSQLANQEGLGESNKEPLLGSVKPPENVYNGDIMTQLRSPIFWSQASVAGYCILRCNFYIASIYSQLHFIATTQAPAGTSPLAVVEIAQSYVDVFNYFLPFGGLVMVPIAGYVMVHLGMVSSFISIGCLLTLSSAIQLLYFLPIQFQIVSFLLYSLVRPFIFGATAAFLGRVFGFANFGRLYGVNRLAGAIFTFLQYPLSSLAEQTFGGNYFYINLGFVICELAIAIIYPLYLWKQVFYGFFFRPPVTDYPEAAAAEAHP